MKKDWLNASGILHPSLYKRCTLRVPVGNPELYRDSLESASESHPAGGTRRGVRSGPTSLFVFSFCPSGVLIFLNQPSQTSSEDLF
jgi:hypothetical protein